MESKLRKAIGLAAGMVAMSGTAIYFGIKAAHADTGIYSATRQEVGNTLQTRVVPLTASGVTIIAAARNDRPDVTCINNSATWIYVSSNTAGTTSSAVGMIVLASSTFRLGAMSGAVYAMLNSGAGEVRCADGLTQ